MLTRSYVALGEMEKAVSTIQDARTALANSVTDLKLFNEALRRFKIDENGNMASGSTYAFSGQIYFAAQANDQPDEMIRSMLTRLVQMCAQRRR